MKTLSDILALDANGLLPCPFCGLSVTQEINIHDSGGEGNRYMHTAKIEHICDGGDYGRPQAKALELFCGKERNEKLLASCAAAQAKRWNTRSTDAALKSMQKKLEVAREGLEHANRIVSAEPIRAALAALSDDQDNGEKA